MIGKKGRKKSTAIKDRDRQRKTVSFPPPLSFAYILINEQEKFARRHWINKCFCNASPSDGSRASLETD